jgi:hypothetical protein
MMRSVVWSLLGFLLTPAALAEPLVSPVQPAASTAAGGPAAGGSSAAASEMAVGERDVVPDVRLFQKGDFSLSMGMLLQTQAAFSVGSDSAIQFEDPADKEGFRVRRARFGFGGRILKDVSYYLAVDLKDTVLAAFGGDRGSEILDASLTWDRFKALQVTVGLDKVPLSVFQLMSSSRLEVIERPLTSNLLAPSRRVGLTLSGVVPTGRIGQLHYVAGVFNGSEGVTTGNRLAGISAGAYLQYALFPPPRRLVPTAVGLSLGGAYMYDDGPAVTAHRASAHLQFQGYQTRLMTEFLYEKSSPKAAPTGEPEAGQVTRKGIAADLTVFVWKPYLQLAFRYEYFFDNELLPTFGQQRLLTGGLNVYFYGDRLKLQVNYIRRDEVSGPAVDNDIAFAQIQASF